MTCRYLLVILILCCSFPTPSSQHYRILRSIETAISGNRTRSDRLSREERSKLRKGKQKPVVNETVSPTPAPTSSTKKLIPDKLKDVNWGNWSSVFEEESSLELAGQGRSVQSYLTLLPTYSFPLHSTGSCNKTIPDDTPENIFLFTDIFICGTAINFISVVYPDYPIDFYRMSFRVVEKQKINAAKVHRVGKNLRILDLTVNSDFDEQVVVGIVGSQKLKSYLEVTDSLLLEVTYAERNMTFHLYRDSKKLQGFVPVNSVSAFALFNNEPESYIFAWMDYYTKYMGIRHFILYYNGIISRSKNVKALISRIDYDIRMVSLLEWNQPYKRLFNWTSNPIEGQYQRIALTTSIHSAYYRFKDSLSWILFTEIGNYMLKKPSSLSLADYLDTCKQKSAAVVVFNKTYAGYMFSHRHRPNVNDTNINIFSKEVVVKGLTYIKGDIFRVKYAANSVGLKLLGIRNKFIFTSSSFRKIDGNIESVRLVPQQRFAMIYGNNASYEKTSFERIHSNLTTSDVTPLSTNESVTLWSSLLNTTVSAISSALDVSSLH